MYNVTATAMYRYRKKVGKWDIEFYVPQRDIKKKPMTIKILKLIIVSEIHRQQDNLYQQTIEIKHEFRLKFDIEFYLIKISRWHVVLWEVKRKTLVLEYEKSVQLLVSYSFLSM